MKKTCMFGITALIVSLGFSNAAHAFWRAVVDQGNTYGVAQGKHVIAMGLTEKQAKKLAKKLNKIQEKDAKSPKE